MSKKGIQIIKSLKRGGAEVLLLNLFRDDQFKKNNKLFILSSECDLLEEFKKIGVETRVFPIFKGRRINILNFFKLLLAFKKDQPLYIHSHLPLTSFIVRLSNIFFNFKLFYTEHNVIDMYNKLTYCLNYYTYFLEGTIISCSKSVQNSLPQKWKRKSIVIYNGINIDYFKQSKDIRRWENLGTVKNPLRIVCVARFRPEKRQYLLVEIINQCKNNLEIELHFVGGGVPSDFKELINKFNLSRNIFIHGELDDIRSIIEISHVFSLVSTYEGLPISLLEAMASGCIPICTAVGGIPEVVDIDFLIKSLNEKEIIDEYVHKLLDMCTKNSNTLSTISQKSIKLIESNFTIDNTKNKLEVIYNS